MTLYVVCMIYAAHIRPSLYYNNLWNSFSILFDVFPLSPHTTSDVCVRVCVRANVGHITAVWASVRSKGCASQGLSIANGVWSWHDNNNIIVVVSYCGNYLSLWREIDEDFTNRRERARWMDRNETTTTTTTIIGPRSSSDDTRFFIFFAARWF